MVEKGDKDAGLRGVMHDGSHDPVDAAARLLGVDPERYAYLKAMPLEELQKLNAKDRAEREAAGEHG